MMRGISLLAVIMLVAGCTSSTGPAESRERLLVVPGISGDGFWYGALRRGLHDGAPKVSIRTVNWGAPVLFFGLNLQSRSIHRKAEEKLLEQILEWHQSNPEGRLHLVGHSAGAGVILESLGKLDESIHVEQVILLNPALAPDYDLGPALAHVRGQVHVFHSEGDTFWLGWGARHFGAYDRKKGEAAGKVGFSSVKGLPAELQSKVVQHAYDPAWKSLGNEGGHFGTTDREFAERILAPLLGTWE